MSLAPGVRLGSHEIVGLLGAGGMGEVYLAQDTKLNRRVAIKVLPEAYAADPDRIARFHREAQAVAALNHSGIAAIYDLAEADGTKFLVLELIEGDTLADRLKRGPVPVEEALQIAKQILEALEAAHERGVCHRDLKPANIKLTPDGNVKVLDFGLAKFLQTSPSAPHMTHSPTLSLAGTYPGVILGTAGYMSPEQAKGFEADQRSDIFSFGCILYELLTGRQAFEGDSASEILASVLKSEVDWSALPPRLNPRLIEVLHRCLEKNPKKRWHAAADVRVEIESIIGRGIVAEEPGAVTPARVPFWKLAAVVAAFTLAGAAIAGMAAWWLKPAPERAVARFTVALPQGQAFTNPGRHVVAMSPDGTHLVYVAENQLYVRPLSGLEARPIAGTHSANGVLSPAFSPDGQSIVFRHVSEGTLKRVALAGGTALTICAADQVYGLSWHEDGIVFGQAGKGILRVSPNGGVPEVMVPITQDEIADTPRLLPDGRGLMFSVRKLTENWDKGQIVVHPRGGARKTLLSGGADAHYLSSGHLAYALGGVVLVVPFDLETLTVTGGPVPIVEGVRRGAFGGVGTSMAPATAQFAVSARGDLAYVPGPVSLGSAQQGDLALFDRKGEAQPLRLPPGTYQAPRVSADGKWVAFETRDQRSEFISVYEIGGRSAPRRLTFGGNSRAPIWSPDGQWIAFRSDREGDEAIYRTRADGSGTAERLTKPEKGKFHIPQSWSPDGQQILFADSGGDITTSSLWVFSLKDRKATRFGDMTAREAAFSPDGRWVAYGVREMREGGNVVFVEPFPATGAKYQFPQTAGHAVWSRKGDELLTNTGPTESHITSVTTTPPFAFGQPMPFPRRGRAEANPLISRRQVDMMPDGRVIGVLSQAATTSADAAQIVVVLNWLDELRQRVPVP
jgi:Tol biopolymer transport system component